MNNIREHFMLSLRYLFAGAMYIVYLLSSDCFSADVN